MPPKDQQSQSQPTKELPAAIRIKRALNSEHPCCYNQDDSKDFHKQYCRNNQETARRHGWYGPAGITCILFSRFAAKTASSSQNQSSASTYKMIDVSSLSSTTTTTSDDEENNGIAYLLGFDGTPGKQYYSFCTGKMSDAVALQNDRGCGIKAACRELLEEFKIEIYDKKANSNNLMTTASSSSSSSISTTTTFNNAENELLPFITSSWYTGNNLSLAIDLDKFLMKKYNNQEEENKKEKSSSSFAEFFLNYFKQLQTKVQSAFVDEKLDWDLRSIRNLKWLVFPDVKKLPSSFIQKTSEKAISVGSNNDDEKLMAFAASALYYLTQKLSSNGRKNNKTPSAKKVPHNNKSDNERKNDDNEGEEEEKQVSVALPLPKSKATSLKN